MREYADAPGRSESLVRRSDTSPGAVDAPAKVSEIDFNRPNPDSPGESTTLADRSGHIDISSLATREKTLESLQANDAEKMTPDEANELSTDDNP